MQKVLSILFIFYLFGFNFAQKTTNDFEKNYVGNLNKNIDVVFHLSCKNGIVNGYYYYANKGIDIALKGIISGDELTLEESDYFNKKVAVIKAKMVNNSILGEWQGKKTNKKLSVNLYETKKEIPYLPKNIQGTYVVDNEDEYSEKCKLAVKIIQKNGDYYYDFKSQLRHLTGKVNFSRHIDSDGIYITLEGIEWAEYGGALNREGESVNENLALPVGIEGLFYENNIDIQNYGNSMNYYTKLIDCGKKFIHLKKN